MPRPQTPQAVCRALGRALRGARGGRPLREVAAASGMSLAHISQSERAEVQPSLDALVCMAGALGLTIFDLFAAAKTLVEEEP